MNNEDEITLKEIILLIVRWFEFFLSKWKVILILGILGSVLGFTLAFLSKPIYTAKLTFALEEKGSGGSYAGIASQFGLDIGGGGGGAFSGDNSIELLKSRYLIEDALLTPVVIEGKRDLLVNRYINYNKLDIAWDENPRLTDIVFNENEPRGGFSVAKDSLLEFVYKSIKQTSLNVYKTDKKLSIIEVKVKSNDQIFAKLFTEVLVSTSSKFYIETKTKRSRQNLDVLENRLDSVKRELDKEIYGVALNKDNNLNTIRAKANVSTAKKQLNIQVLTTMYGELVKNTELAKYTLMREEPLIQIIDSPILPLERTNRSKRIWLILGGILGGISGMLYFWFKEMKMIIMGNPN